MRVPPGVATPEGSLACRFVLLPNAFKRPMMLPMVGVLGVARPLESGTDEGLLPQPEKSSGVVPDVDTDPRLVRSEK